MNNYQKEVIALIPKLNGYALKLTNYSDKANDLLQDTLLKAILKESKFQKGTNLKAFLYRMMHNIFIDYTRLWNKKEYSIDDFVHIDIVSNSPIFSNLSVEIINDLINNLPKKPKKCFVLRQRGFSYEEISIELKMALGSVRSNIFVAKKILKEQLKQLDYE
jgi:RNA polymerase sigma-70 factor, ECF subfamily